MIIDQMLSSNGIQLGDVKVHLAIGGDEKNRLAPLIELSKGKFKEWQELQTKDNFQRKYILSLVFLRPNEWIFAGVYKPLSVKKKSETIFIYETELTPVLKEFIGRMIIYFKKDFRASYILLEKFIDHFEIVEILRTKYMCDPFPGYHNFTITYEQLRLICKSEEPSWKTALSIVNGIYLICDGNNGKLYVGKADGENGIWKRWSSYADTIHGNNKELVKLVESKKPEYFMKFNYSILETLNDNVDQEYIDRRESHWKRVLLSRDFGYNFN